MHVCHVNRPVSADFSVDVFFSLGFKTRAEIQPASSLRTPRSKYTCLGFVWITRGLARARAVLEGPVKVDGLSGNFSKRGFREPVLGIF